MALAGFLDRIAERRGELFPWAPVCFAIGIGIYFGLQREPGLLPYIITAMLFAAALALSRLTQGRWHIPAVVVTLLTAGFLAAGYRAHAVAGPVLSFRYYGPVQGRIVDIDRSFSDAIRITLDAVILSDVSPSRTPDRVRVALHGKQEQTRLVPGLTVMLTAHLAPPEGPVAPGGFDFQRLAWFSRLGGVGYTRAPVVTVAASENGWALAAFRARMTLSAAIQAHVDGQAGAMASAFLTGDRSAINAETNAAMRSSNLSHLISISGLHMGLVVSLVFAWLRYGIALVPPLALRVNAKKLAAATALVAATGYLALAGPDIATERAYIMAAVMLIAILARRQAISLRTVSVAAMIVLAIEPESLTEPGFQMSFGATVALILAFRPWATFQHSIPPWTRPIAMLFLSSFVAGFATGPIAAAHFNRIAGYGLIANLLAVPVMGIVVMPAGVIAALLAPVGLAAPALWALEKGTDLILQIAHFVAGIEGAVGAVVAPPHWVLPVLALGALAVTLGHALLRGIGVVAASAALAAWVFVPRPDMLIASGGQLVGVMTEDGRALSKPKGGGFIATSWLEDDGDLADQETAFARGLFVGARGQAHAEWQGISIVHLTGKTSAERAVPFCLSATLIVIDADWTGSGDCEVWDRRRLRETGAVAIYRDGAETSVVSARDFAGNRLWNRTAGRRGAATVARDDNGIIGPGSVHRHGPADRPPYLRLRSVQPL